MDPKPDYVALENALRRCGANWTAAQCHGLLTGRLASGGRASKPEWISQVLDDLDTGSPSYVQCRTLLDSTFESTDRQLAERLSAFEPLLPDDDADADVRATALAHWCEGFLHGLVSAKDNDEVRQRLAAEPLDDIIKDLLQMTRATVGEDVDDEDAERAYAELVEYLRVAAQLAYEELTDVRGAA